MIYFNVYRRACARKPDSIDKSFTETYNQNEYKEGFKGSIFGGTGLAGINRVS
jgi:hypothetical protein